MTPELVRRVERLNLVVGLVLVVGALLLGSRAHVLGVLVGAALSVANFAIIRRLVEAALQGDRRRAGVQFVLIGKMAALILLVFLAMRFLPISPAALAVGLSTFFISIAIESVRTVLGQKAQNGRA